MAIVNVAAASKQVNMLFSTRILVQYSTKTTLVRDWRVVNITDDDAMATDVATFFCRILDHVYDILEPIVPTPTDKIAPIRAAIGGSQSGEFQDIPLAVHVSDVAVFGKYMKFYIIREDADIEVSCSERNAFEVSSCNKTSIKAVVTILILLLGTYVIS